MLQKKTKIVCTLGPASEDPVIIEKMVMAGMNVVRLNFSHGSYDQFSKIIRNIRAVEKKLNIPIAIMQDLQGPKIRVGEMPANGIEIKKGQTVILTTAKISGHSANVSHKTVTGHGANVGHNIATDHSANVGHKTAISHDAAHRTHPTKTTAFIPVQYQHLPQDVKTHDHILIDDGLMELKVDHVKGHEIFCTVITPGIIKSHKGINVPTASIKANPITAKDKQDLLFGLRQNVDYVALSFVKSAEDIKNLRTLIQQKKGHAKIIAKIERHEAVTNLEGIIAAADGVMVARGDLGIEIPAEKVPLVQKRIIHLANLSGKPVITATQILQSMVENPRATRAEISDAANAVFDHSDALMLSNESAVGKYPVEATQTLAKVAASIEEDLQQHKDFIPHRFWNGNLPPTDAICLNAAKLAMDMNAKFIVAITQSGFTAQHIAKHRVYIPIIALTHDRKVQHQLTLVWGIQKTYIQRITPHPSLQHLRTFLLKAKLVKRGDKVVVVSNASKAQKLISSIKI